MEQAKALNALEPFLALSKSATSPRAAADLIQRATSAPNTYIFTELLQSPQIQALDSAAPEFRQHLALLRIFSHGDYQTYEAASASASALPPLGDAQRLKLRQLSLLSLAASGRRENLTYDRLQASLGLDSPRALETLVTTAIYAGLIDARLDPARQRVQVTSVAPLRDLNLVGPGGGDVADMLAALRGWSARCESVLDQVGAHMAQVHQGARVRAAEELAAGEKMARAVAEVRGGADGKKAAAAGGIEGLTRRGMMKQQRAAAAKVPATESMELDGLEDGMKRAGKRKM